MSFADRFSLATRTALVTGASGGLGAHFAQTLAQAGAHVVLAARRSDKLVEHVDRIQAQGGSAEAIALDVTDTASVVAAFDALAAQGRLPDIAVNNAGIVGEHLALETSDDEWQRVIDTNLNGAWRVAREFGKRLVAAGKPGSLINVASILGERVAVGVAPYCASKAALIQLTQALALEWARHGIRANALAPGYIITDLNRDFLASAAGDKLLARIPQKRFGDMRDLEGPLLLLASDAGAFMTGAVLAADGGNLVNTL